MLNWMTDNLLLIGTILGGLILVLILLRHFSFRWRNLMVYSLEKQFECRMERLKPEKVEFSVFAPTSITKNSMFILDVWAYLPHQYEAVKMVAKELDRDKLRGTKHGVEVKRGSVLSIVVEINDIDITEPVDTLVWNGIPTNASFTVSVPGRIELGQHSGKVTVAYGGMVICKIPFIIDICINEQKYIGNISGEAFYPETAFASYTSENREEVLARIQGMKKVAPDLDVFLDVLSLRAGQHWQEELKQHVPTKDVFYLFWSHHAAKSDWVNIEWRFALDKRGLHYIDPVPLEDIEQAPPPEELKELHFNDSYVAYIQYERLKKAASETLTNQSCRPPW